MLDVRCDKCATEYEIEKDRVPPEGLSVKCSHCSHVFTAFREDLPRPDLWTVQAADGSTHEFREFTTLQRWIVERKVSRDDQISRSGQNWKRLGDIAELATFFQLVDQADAGRSAPMPNPGPAPVTLQPAHHGAPAPRRTTSPHARINPSLEQADTSDVGFDADDDYDDFAVKRGGMGKWIGILALLLAVAGGALYLLKPAFLDDLLRQTPSPLVLSHIDDGYKALHRNSRASIEEAIKHFEKAVALAEGYADAKAALAQGRLVKAEWMLEQAALMVQAAAALSDEEKAKVSAEAKTIDDQARSLAEQAFNVGKQALELDPRGLASTRSMADYYRIKRAAGQMQQLLERAKVAAPNDPGLAYVSGASAAQDKAATDRAIRYLDAALEQAPHMQRARYLLARLHQQSGNTEKAVLQLQTLIKAVPEHENAKGLLVQLQPPEPEPEPEVEPEPKPKAKPKLTLEQLVAQAERLRQADKAVRALKIYERALEMEPGDPDAMVGMGWCYIDMENINSAIATFKRVLTKLPRFSDAHMGLAEAYAAKGMKRDAVKHYRKYLDIVPDGPDAVVAKRMLEQLQ